MLEAKYLKSNRRWNPNQAFKKKYFFPIKQIHSFPSFNWVVIIIIYRKNFKKSDFTFSFPKIIKLDF